MKQRYKNYLFANFENSLFKKVVEKNKLTIYENYNIKSSGQSIKTLSGIENFIIQKIENIDIYNEFFNKNREILQKIIYLFDYEFFDETDFKTKIRYFCIDEEFNIYELNFEAASLKFMEVKLTQKPRIIKADGYLYLYDASGVYVLECLGDFQYFDGVFEVKSFLYFDDKICLLSQRYPNSIFISEKTELLNLASQVECYEKIDFDLTAGEIFDIKKIKDDIIILMKYKILKYDLYASKNKILAEYEIGSRVLKNTVSVINDNIIFLTESGLKIFDGNNLKTTFCDIVEQIDKNYEDVIAVTFNDKYYLNSKIFIKDKYENILISFDIEGEQSYYLNTFGKIKNIQVLQNNQEYKLLLFCDSDANGIFTLTENIFNVSQYLKFNKIYFEVEDAKQITKLKLISTGRFYLKIISDIEEQVFFVDDIKEFNMNLKGHIFEFEIMSDECFLLESLMVEVMVVEENL